MTKVIKKKKLRLLPFFIFVIVIAITVFLFLIIADTKVKNIIITGNDIISDEEILEATGLINYPSFYKTTKGKIEKAILKNPLVKSVKIDREFYHIFNIEIEEYEILYKREDNGKYVLENKDEITLDNNIPYMIPRLINEIPDNKINSFIKYYKRIDKSIREKISEIKYDPNEYDKDRFLVYMDDGNCVFLTITKFERINYYNDVLPQLGGRKGYLYLDSGNHFQIMQ